MLFRISILSYIGVGISNWSLVREERLQIYIRCKYIIFLYAFVHATGSESFLNIDATAHHTHTRALCICIVCARAHARTAHTRASSRCPAKC